MAYPTFKEIERKGFSFHDNARGWLAMDAALTTNPNSTVPYEILNYISPTVIEVLTAPRVANQIFNEVRVGDWTTANYKYPVIENTGEANPYADYGDGAASGVNVNWNNREQYIFQTSITYGDLEVDMNAQARINLVDAKQKAAAQTIAIASNKYAMFGVSGKAIYGLLNDPDLPPAITPAVVNGAVTWADKAALGNSAVNAVYADWQKLFGQLVKQTNGLIDANSEMYLLISPDMAVTLATTSQYNVSVMDMINKNAPNLKVIQVPELSTPFAGNTMMLMVKELSGQDTGELAFGEKLRTGRVVSELSAFRQKFSATTYGFIMKIPAAFAIMSGL